MASASDQLSAYPIHGPEHALFLSSQAEADATIVGALTEMLPSIALRRYGQPLTIFHEDDSLDDANAWNNLQLALSRSKVVVAVLSQAAVDSMMRKAESGQQDKTLIELQTALRLIDQGQPLSIMPLCVFSLTNNGDQEVWRPFWLQNVTIPGDPRFGSLRETVSRLSQIQMFGIYPDLVYMRIYRILNLVHPIELDSDIRNTIYRKYFCDSKLRVDPAHLDSLLRQVTLTGRAVISGMGGMGKSVLARQFLRFMMGTLDVSNKDDLKAIKAETIGIKPQYSQVFWLNCSTESTALDGLIDMFPGIKPDVIKEHASMFLANTHGYLLVLDNVDDIGVVDSVFEHSRSLGFAGDVVVTTRLASLPPGTFASALGTHITGYGHAPLRLGTWDNTIALDYILSASPLIAERTRSTEALETLKRIVVKIDGYPLVIQTFITYAENCPTPLYVIEEEFAGALEEEEGEDQTRSSLKVIVDLAMDSLVSRGNEGIEAAMLFGALTLVAPTNIQPEIIEAIAQKLGVRNDVSNLVTMVLQSGLLRNDGERVYSTHSLTQQVAREFVKSHNELKPDEIENVTGMALIDLAGLLDKPYLLEHLDCFSKAVVPQRYSKPLHSRIDCCIAKLADSRGLFAKAMEVSAENVQRSEAFYGTRSHVDVASAIQGLGDVALSLGRHTEALGHHQEALEIRVRIFGTKEHPSVARTVQQIGSVELSLGKYDAALAHFQEALEIQKMVQGMSASRDISVTLDSIAYINFMRGQYDEALRLFNECLQIDEQFYGNWKHPSTLATLYSIADIYKIQGRLDDALQLYQEIMATAVGVYGTRRHPSISSGLYSMAGLLHTQGNNEEALKCCKECQEIEMQLYGREDHPDVAKTTALFARIIHSQGRHEEALTHFQKLYDIRLKIFGTEEHPEVASAISGIAEVLQSQGDNDKALDLFRKTLSIETAVYGTREHPSVAETLVKIAQVLCSQDDDDEALVLYQEAQATLLKAYGTKMHRAISNIQIRIADIKESEGDLDEAQRLYEEVLEIDTAILGTREHYLVSATLRKIADIVEQKGNLEEAFSRFRDILDLDVIINGTREHPDAVSALSSMADIARTLEHYDEARALYQEALGIETYIHGTRDHPDVADTIASLAKVESDQGRLAEAQNLYEEALATSIKAHGKRETDEIATILMASGEIATKQGRFDAASQLIQESLDILLEIDEPTLDPDIAQAHLAFGDLFSSQSGTDEDALRHYSEALAIANELPTPDYQTLVDRARCGINTVTSR